MSGQKLGQILEKPCVRSRGHIFGLIHMKLGQNGCLDEIWNKLEYGLCGIKNQVSRSNLEVNEISDKFENGSCCVKNQVKS